VQGAALPANFFGMTEADRSRKSGVALEKTYQFLLWLIPAVEKFPRSQKFLLGDRIQTLALDVQESLIEATYARKHPRAVMMSAVHHLRLAGQPGRGWGGMYAILK
jgi:hypothetical protein